MRILFIAHRVPYPPNKGEKLRALWELRELSKKHTVDLFCFYDDPEDKKHARELSRYCCRLYLEKLSFAGSRLRALAALLLGRPFTTAFFHSDRMARRTELALRSGYYDRVVVYSSSMAHYAHPAGNIPKVLDLVDVDSDKWLQYANHSPWPWSWLWRREARLLGEYESSLVRAFSSTLVCTDAEAHLLRSKAPDGRINVLQNFFDVDHYMPQPALISPSIRALQPYLVFSGSMDYRPNIDAVRYFSREILPLIRRAVPDVRLVIAGRNPDRSVVALGVDPSVHVTGSVADMRPYIWGAAAAVVPMRIARGVQNKILEALAAGIPVVSSSAAASALPFCLRSLLNVADSPQDVSAAVVRLLLDGSEISSNELRGILKSYIGNLDLPAELQRLVRNPTENVDPIQKPNVAPSLQLGKREIEGWLTTQAEPSVVQERFGMHNL